jgi:hypothetical protein
MSKPEEMTREQLEARVAELEGRIAKRDNQPLGAKVGEKGGVSLTGTGQYPVTQYYEQWVRIFKSLEVPETNWFYQFVMDADARGQLAHK